VWVLQRDEIKVFIDSAQQQDARLWLHEAMASLQHDMLVTVVVTLWAVWYAKRKVIHENLYQSPLSTHCFVERFLADLEAIKIPSKEKHINLVKPTRWIAPPSGFMKINVDAAIAKNSVKVSMAAVAHDEAGQFMGASVLVLAGVSDPEMAEAIACREGLALAADLMIQRFKVTSDCLNVIRNLRGPAMGSYGHIVREIKARASDFEEVVFAHEGRETNFDAHRLAKGSVSESLGRHVWFSVPPPGVCIAVNSEP